MCAFSGAGLGPRCSVSGLRRRFGSGAGYQVPGARYPEPGTRYQAPVFEKPAHGVCMMQDRSGPDSDYLAPGTWYLTPMPHSPIYRGEIQNLFKTKVHSGQACKLRISEGLCQTRVRSWTQSTRAWRCSTGVWGRTPWPRLKICPGRPPTRSRTSWAAARIVGTSASKTAGSRFP